MPKAQAVADLNVAVIADSQAPTTPAALVVTATGQTTVGLVWGPSSHPRNLPISYQVRRGGVLITTVSVLFFNDTGLAPSTTYNYSVVAVSVPGNSSGAATGSATTQAATGGAVITNERTSTTYTTVQAAVNAALNADSLVFGAGPYTSPTDIDYAQATITFKRSPAMAAAGLFPTLTWLNAGAKGGFHRTNGGPGTLTVDGIICVGPGQTGNNHSWHWEESHTGVFNLVARNLEVSLFDNGIFMGNRNSDTCTIENVQVHHCGNAGDGSTHNIYVGEIANIDVKGLWSHDCFDGHLFKCRALNGTVDAVLCDSGIESNSREFEVPCGGTWNMGSMILIQRDNSGNGDIFAFANEGASNPQNCQAPGRGQVGRLAQSVIVNYRNPGVFTTIGGGLFPSVTFTRIDNVFVGINAPTVAGNSTFADDSVFVDPANFDFRLKVPVAGSQNWSGFEYVHPAKYKARTDSFRGAMSPQPLWMTTALGATPRLNEVAQMGTWKFTDFGGTVFNGANVAALLESYSAAYSCRESDSRLASFNGGHTDEGWNGWFCIPCEADNPVPFLLSPASPVRPGGVFYNPDGKGAACHSYKQGQCLQSLNQFVMVGRSFCAGNFDPNCGELDAVDCDTGVWQQSSPGVSVYPAVPGSWGDASSTWGNSPTAHDRNTDDLFQWNAGGLRHWVKSEGARGTWHTRNTVPRTNNVMTEYDPVRQRIVGWGETSSSPQVPVYALRSENFATWHTLSVSGATAGLSTDYWAITYDPWLDCFWLCNDLTDRTSGFRKMTFTNTTENSPAVVTAVSFAGINPSTLYTWGNEGTMRWGALKHIRRLKGISWRTAANGGQYFVRTAA